MKENEFKEQCPQCQEDDVYSETLTNGLCLNCHYDNEREYREMDIEYDLHQRSI